MIGDILFFIKTLVMTFVMVVILQVKVGEFTLEQQMAHWARESSVMEPIQQAAHGGVIAIREGWRELVGQLGGKVKDTFRSDEAPGNRNLGIKFERSKAYFKEAAEQTKKLAAAKVKEAEQMLREKADEAKDDIKEKAHHQSDELFDELEREGFSE